jgi:hypothetical protein
MQSSVKALMCQGPSHSQNATKYSTHVHSAMVYCGVIVSPNNGKEHTALMFKCPVDEAELSRTTHPTMQRHMPEDQIFIHNPNEEHNRAFHILRCHC